SPGFLKTRGTAPEGRKSRLARILRSSGVVLLSYVNPGLTAGATLFRPSGPLPADYSDSPVRSRLYSSAAPRLLGVLMICLACLTSCGYHVAGKKLHAGKGLTIAVPTFVNRTTAYRIEQNISEAVRQELIRRTRFSVESQETGDVVVTGEVR